VVEPTVVSDAHEIARDIISAIAVAALLGLFPLVFKLLRIRDLTERHEEQLNDKDTGLVTTRVPRLESDRQAHKQEIEHLKTDVSYLRDSVDGVRTPAHGTPIVRPRRRGGDDDD
jgi:hypothetical protein